MFCAVCLCWSIRCGLNQCIYNNLCLLHSISSDMPIFLFHLSFTGSLAGSAVLLSDEPIFVQDDNYFHTPATPLSPSQDPNNCSGGGGDGEGNKDNGTAGTINTNHASAGATTGIAAVGVCSVNSPTTGKIISTYYFFTYVITCLMSVSLV